MNKVRCYVVAADVPMPELEKCPFSCKYKKKKEEIKKSVKKT